MFGASSELASVMEFGFYMRASYSAVAVDNARVLSASVVLYCIRSFLSQTVVLYDWAYLSYTGACLRTLRMQEC